MHGLFLWKIEKGTRITNSFQKIVGKSNRNPKKILVDKGSENIRAFKKEIYKYMN